MSKAKTQYVCSQCGGTSPKWMGRCPSCGQYDTMTETRVEPKAVSSNRYANWSGAVQQVRDLKSISPEETPRMTTGIGELDRVLGGGLVRGSMSLIGGDPGIGKSTLLLQSGAAMGEHKRKILYVTGEESPGQISMRARRLGLGDADIRLASETDVTAILDMLEQERPDLAIIDSIQTIYHPELQSAPGTVAQVRDCAAHLTRAAKSSGCAIFLVGHVTKEGSIAGPQVLEHMVDTVLFFEGDTGTPYRMLRALKNRFGAVNEMGVFAMGERGLEEVSNPSSLFLTQHDEPVSGCAVLAAMEGNRPLLVEVQCLVEDAVTPNPKRYASGFETSRLQIILAVLNKHVGIDAFNKNVYMKIVGGVRLTEPAADFAALLAVQSSFTSIPLPTGLVAFGEVGLAGELRPVQDIEARLKEAAKLGFTKAFVPRSSRLPKIDGLEIHAFARVEDAIKSLVGRRKAA